MRMVINLELWKGVMCYTKVFFRPDID